MVEAFWISTWKVLLLVYLLVAFVMSLNAAEAETKREMVIQICVWLAWPIVFGLLFAAILILTPMRWFEGLRKAKGR